VTFRDQLTERISGGWTDIQAHLPYMHSVAARYPRVRVLELGVRTGESTRAFLAAAEETGGHVWSCDIEQPQVPVDDWLASGLWSLTVCDDMTLGPIANVSVLFIDTGHEYGATIAELYRFVPMVAPGGLVLLHDTEWREPDFPVARALDTYCAETGRTWRNHTGSYGLGEIEIP
jgi:hypothetical protein